MPKFHVTSNLATGCVGRSNEHERATIMNAKTWNTITLISVHVDANLDGNDNEKINTNATQQKV